MDCQAVPPPTEHNLINALDRYRASGINDRWQARFLLMSEAWMQQTDAIGICNIQLQKLRMWEKEHVDLEKKNDSRRSTK